MRSKAASFLNRFFKIHQNGTNIRTEILAGLTTFLTMAYIIFVQPTVLVTDFAGNPTGMDFGAVLLATCLVSAGATVLMGLYANYPIALAPGMGENFFFVSVIMALTALGFSHAWQTALGIVLIAGLLFLLLSLLGVRQAILEAISPSMKSGIAVGIGLFITLIGFQHSHLIVAKPGTMLGINTHIMNPDIGVFFIGLMVTSILLARRVRGSILIGILVAAACALVMGEIRLEGLVGLPAISHPVAFRMNIAQAMQLACLPFIAVFLFMDMFDTVGTLVGVAETAGLMKDNKLPRAQRVLTVDSAATVAGACLGTSTVTSYIESAAGVAYGGRTGLTSVVTGFLFLCALFFGPLIKAVGGYSPITASALIIVGAMMLPNVKKIDWQDYSESIPAFLVMTGIPLFYSIADGLALGFISYPVIKIFSGRMKDLRWLHVVMAILLLGYFIFIRARLG